MLALRNARLIDGTGAPPRNDVTVTLDDGRINQISETGQIQVSAGDSVIDLQGRTLLPGLIDAHVHLSSLGLPQLAAASQDVPPDLHAYGLALVSRAMLEGGITTVRDAGSYGQSLFALRQAMGLELCIGPRLVLCGQIVAATSPGGRLFTGMYRQADGPDELRKAVREQISQGADFIKVMATGALTVAGEDVHPAQMTLPEMQAIVQEAHRMGRAVAAHAEGLEGIRLSLEAGVNTIEHGEMSYQAPDVLEIMAGNGTILVPTLSVFDKIADSQGQFPDWMVEQAKRLRESAYQTVAAALRAGVALAMGADTGPHGKNAQELVRMVEAGLSPMEGIVAATSAAARACRLQETIGTVTPGKVADLLVVDGDPIEDVRLFLQPEKVWLVLQNGNAVAGTRRRSGFNC